MICTAITTFVVGLALTYSTVVGRREKATLWWCMAMWSATAGLVLLAFRGIGPWWLAIGLGNALTLVAYGLAWKGFTVFLGRASGLVPVWGGAALWCLLYFGLPDLRADYSARVILASVMIIAYCVLICLNAWRGWTSEGLPGFLALLVLFATHGLVYVARAALTIAFPVDERYGTGSALWLSMITLEVFVHVIGISFVFFALSKERAEQRYRLAAEIDSLTSSATRRFFVSETKELLARKRDKGVLAAIDLDFFKSINDSFGHMGGDRVLQTFGAHVAARLGPDMVFGRLGGEEFGIFIPGMSETEAGDFLEALRADIEALEIPFMGNPIRITISIGVASIRDTGPDFDHLMAAADSALYIAKDEGRNRLRFFSLAMRMTRIVEAGMESRVGLSETRLSRAGVRVQPRRA